MPILREKVWMRFMVVVSGEVAAYGEQPAYFGKYRANASWKSSAPLREGQIDGRFVPPSRGQEKRLRVELSPEKKTFH